MVKSHQGQKVELSSIGDSERVPFLSEASQSVDDASKVAVSATNQTIQHLNELSQITLDTTNQTIQQINENINRITDNVVTHTGDTLDQINEWFKEK